MTERKQLSQRDFVAMLLNQGARIPCPCCGLLITDPDNIRREHLNTIKLSGDDSIGNQQLWHRHPCSHAKTYGKPYTSYGSDAHEIAKAKRLSGETPPKPKRDWPSRAFPKRGPQGCVSG